MYPSALHPTVPGYHGPANSTVSSILPQPCNGQANDASKLISLMRSNTNDIIAIKKSLVWGSPILRSCVLAPYQRRYPTFEKFLRHVQPLINANEVKGNPANETKEIDQDKDMQAFVDKLVNDESDDNFFIPSISPCSADIEAYKPITCYNDSFDLTERYAWVDNLLEQRSNMEQFNSAIEDDGSDLDCILNPCLNGRFEFRPLPKSPVPNRPSSNAIQQLEEWIELAKSLARRFDTPSMLSSATEESENESEVSRHKYQINNESPASQLSYLPHFHSPPAYSTATSTPMPVPSDADSDERYKYIRERLDLQTARIRETRREIEDLMTDADWEAMAKLRYTPGYFDLDEYDEEEEEGSETRSIECLPSYSSLPLTHHAITHPAATRPRAYAFSVSPTSFRTSSVPVTDSEASWGNLNAAELSLWKFRPNAPLIPNDNLQECTYFHEGVRYDSPFPGYRPASHGNALRIRYAASSVTSEYGSDDEIDVDQQVDDDLPSLEETVAKYLRGLDDEEAEDENQVNASADNKNEQELQDALAVLTGIVDRTTAAVAELEQMQATDDAVHGHSLQKPKAQSRASSKNHRRQRQRRRNRALRGDHNDRPRRSMARPAPQGQPSSGNPGRSSPAPLYLATNDLAPAKLKHPRPQRSTAQPVADMEKISRDLELKGDR
ncbi:hypothetical protein L228DRAFT_286111 [Xylona heveae TC161]|uniref:Uncharacterized protein n=1 Tax=Xylona heveae (strain CBS 132557 / TC161) TaxID=1328760 RepID=A0A164ZM29_XYLHT|nr:hypothetical protein L228DRAFT_286111 [Xylona heveae TC161]KZF19263.1 hypothetical protein L228DRAFT_286111 [Xylona heveae TC161]